MLLRRGPPGLLLRCYLLARRVALVSGVCFFLLGSCKQQPDAAAVRGAGALRSTSLSSVGNSYNPMRMNAQNGVNGYPAVGGMPGGTVSQKTAVAPLPGYRGNGQPQGVGAGQQLAKANSAANATDNALADFKNWSQNVMQSQGLGRSSLGTFVPDVQTRFMRSVIAGAKSVEDLRVLFSEFDTKNPVTGRPEAFLARAEHFMSRAGLYKLFQKMKPIHHDYAEKYLSKIISKIAAKVPALTSGVQVILVDSGKPNLAASVGSHTILVDVGLLREAKSEDELAMVLAHELAHDTRRTGFLATMKIMGAQDSFQEVRDTLHHATTTPLPPSVAELRQWDQLPDGPFLFAGRYAIFEESQADAWALQWAQAAGYNPRAQIDYYHRVMVPAERVEEVGLSFSNKHPKPQETSTPTGTHPSTVSRIQYIKDHVSPAVAQKPYQVTELQKMQNALRATPPVRANPQEFLK